jgi:ankyrin repeat protein
MKYFEKTCSPKCRSLKHAGDLISLTTKTNDTQILLSGFMQCWNITRIHDELGRYLIYMAACCGRTEAVEWLIKFKKADFHVRNGESGWTPAHSAAFYGHIDTLIMLIKSGANLNKLDHDTLNVLEHLSLDKYLASPYKPDIHGI